MIIKLLQVTIGISQEPLFPLTERQIEKHIDKEKTTTHVGAFNKQYNHGVS